MFEFIQLLDGLHMYQDFDFDLPSLGGLRSCIYDAQTGEVHIDREAPFTYEGSHTTSIKINISGRRITISRGNPSKVNRIDNLFGFKTVDDCVFVYNQILLSLSLPPFTKCTRTWQLMGEDGKRVFTVSDGAVITEIHTTSNKRVGKGNEHEYLRTLSTQRLRNSIPHLMPNGCTVQWLSAKGLASLVHSCVYDKANEIALHQLPKIKKHYGETSKEYKQLLKVHNYCKENGVVRFENKHKARQIKKLNIQFWGISDYSILDKYQKEFLELNDKISVNEMTIETISEQLIEEGIVNTIQAANATSTYYFKWLQGQRFDLTKSSVKKNRARLRKLHIDIAETCDISKHSAIRVKAGKEIEVFDLEVPDWYELPQLRSHLRLVS